MAPLHPIGSRSLAVSLAAALLCAPVGVRAQPAAPPAAEADPNPLADAQRLYERGRAKFETADYTAAVELWTEAYALVPDNTDGAQIRVLLIYNIATARERAFEVTEDPAELRQAKILLRNFEKSIPAIYGDGEEAEAERKRVGEKIAGLDERLEEFERAQQPEPTPQPVVEPPSEPTPPEDEPEPARNSKGLIIGGAVAAGLGVGGFGLMAAGLSIGSGANDLTDLADDDITGRRDQFDRGRTGNRLAVIGGIAGGLLLTTGAVLLAIGLRRKNSGNVALRPVVGPTTAGMVLGGRF